MTSPLEIFFQSLLHLKSCHSNVATSSCLTCKTQKNTLQNNKSVYIRQVNNKQSTCPSTRAIGSLEHQLTPPWALMAQSHSLSFLHVFIWTRIIVWFVNLHIFTYILSESFCRSLYGTTPEATCNVAVWNIQPVSIKMTSAELYY